MLILAVVSCLLWLGLLFGHGRFWQGGPILAPARPAAPIAPRVHIVVPARDEAESIEVCLASLLNQAYDGPLSVVLVNDRSTDRTAALARALPDPHGRLTVIDGVERPAGWSGKLWAVHQGVAAVRAAFPDEAGFLFLTDADIHHAPEHVATLVHKAERDGLDQVSEMVALNCESLPERLLVPAFVFFFAMLYPFDKVADSRSRVAGAAGGSILIRRSRLAEIGGIEVLRGALIDDCTLAAHVKRSGGGLYLGHSRLAKSVRPYPDARDVWRMIARTAYVQLRYSPVALVATVLLMLLVWIVPPVASVFGRGRVRVFGGAAWAMSTVSFLPTLRRFGLSPLYALALPGIALFYTGATVQSAVDHHFGRGVVWKGRAYAEGGASTVGP
ncbi:glycosyltransferase [Ameyamaea chiangmaiensis NBRC 103196]|uniref:Glycosyltransferase n=1 Tax=Ameyamaea chiangmaiensis TaxID=442969 RepID=A0A850PI37_9PROT|nr:glycosyltransferase [Ameyamaea chiangmaiensis]MBS4074243.1 glycosyltransferase [Ameyamaea chiangmaiensis]NVN41906.1 glycosyltransferase [Ameyamaea chiangmaiensis]GBQ71359.1 glycosyltransferase [Ameyamaea chiangmaiensis NBRC 103196]